MNLPRYFSFAVTALVYCLASPNLHGQNTHRAHFNRVQAQYLSAASSPSLNLGNGGLTVEGWVKVPSGSADIEDIYLISKVQAGDLAYTLSLENGGYIFGRVENASLSNQSTLYADHVYVSMQVDDGSWHHLAMTYDQNTMRLYVDGLLAADKAVGSKDASNAAPLLLGKAQGPANLDGSMDEVRIWSSAHTQAQIQATMFNELLGAESGLKGYWKLNNSMGDDSGNGNALTNNNVAIFQTNDLPFSDSNNQLEWCPQSGLKALFHFENLNDSSGGGNALANNGPVTFTQGKFSNAASFNGSDQWLGKSFPVGLPTGSGARTVSVWYKLSNVAPCYLVDYGTAAINQHFAVKIDDGTHYSVDLGTSAAAITIPTAITAGVWNNVVVTYSGTGSAFSIYHNGVLLGNVSIVPPNTGSTYLSLGSYNSSVAEGMLNGSLDEVAIFDRALTAEEIMKYYGGIVSARFASIPSGDGHVGVRLYDIGQASFSAARDASSGNNTEYPANPAGIDGLVMALNDSGYYSTDVVRLFLPFDTRTLPLGTVVQHAKVSAHTMNKRVSGTDSNSFISVAASTQVSPASLTNNDYALVGSSQVSDQVMLDNISIGTRCEWTLSDAGRGLVSAANYSRFVLRIGNDFNNTVPNLTFYAGGSDQAVFATGDHSTSTFRPFLLVEYAKQNIHSISGTVLYAGSVTGPIVISCGAGQATLSSPGAYSITELVAGAYSVTAYLDTNHDGSHQPWEPLGSYAGNPISLSGILTGIDITLGPPSDTDNDGLSDVWEQANGLIVGVNESMLSNDNDALTNVQEYYLGTNPSLNDTDGDGVQDGVEFAAGMKLLSADSDGDGLPDAWEMANGLNPLVNDTAGDADGDGLTNAQEYNGGVNSTNANNRDSDGNGVSDYEQRNAAKFIKHRYDRVDRLVTTLYNNGAWEGWRYDGNGNILRHLLRISRDADSDGLADAWEFAQGLAFDSSSGSQGFGGDADGDGWTNQQEFLADTAANDATSMPSTGTGSTAWATPPKSRIVFPASSGGALAHVTVRLWDAEANRAQAALQWWDATASLWKPATISKVNNGPITNATSLTTTPAGTTHDFLWNALADLPTHNGPILLRTTSQDPAGTTTSETVPYALNTTGDFDGDGIPDTWEIAQNLDPNDATGHQGATADADNDGLNTFGEYVFGLNLAASDAKDAATVGEAINPADGKRYLTLTYRKLINASGLIYAVQTASDLATWSPDGPDIEPISAVPTGDGITELITVRVKPPLGTTGANKFVRVQVTKHVP